MKAFIKDIFEYHNYMNSKLIDLFIENHGRIPERSMFLFSHCVNAHQVWNSRILKSGAAGLNDIHPVQKLKTMHFENHGNTIRIIDEFSLNDMIDFKNSKGDSYTNTIFEILFQIANHFTHHKGQIMTDLRQNGITPFISDYIYYKWSV